MQLWNGEKLMENSSGLWDTWDNLNYSQMSASEELAALKGKGKTLQKFASFKNNIISELPDRISQIDFSENRAKK